ncbi:MAG TPA: hypothetical protein VF412_05215 [Bdellovibrio sp.]
MYPDAKSLRKAAAELGLSFEAARHARDYGKGSVETLMGLLMHGLNIAPNSLQKNLPKVLKMFDKPGALNTFESLLQQAIENYGQNEIIAWIRLLNARHEIEKELGLIKKPGRRPRSPK